MVDVDCRLPGDLHAAPRHHRRQRRAARHPALAALLVLGPAVGDKRLRADARRLSAHLRRGGRSDRTKASVRGGPVRVHRLLGGMRTVHVTAHAEPRARRAGHRRSDDVRHVAGAARPGLSRQGARDGLWRVRRRDGRSGGGGACARRGHHLEHRLGMDLLRERPDRGDRGVRHAHPGGRVARPGGHRSGLGRPPDLLRIAVPARLRPHAGQRKGLGLPGDRRLPDRRGRPVGGVRRGRARAEPPDARPHAVSPPGLRGSEHRRVRPLGLVLRDVPVHDPLPPGRARLRPAAGGTAVPAHRPCCPSSWRPCRES